MNTALTYRIAARLAGTTALLMFALIVIGSVVRTTGSGLACPDWPLCQGRLIPPLQFNVLIEWSHRLVALIVSLMVAITVGWVLPRRELRRRMGGLATLAVVLLFAQVMLGALTVWKLLDPSVVNGHLAVALLLFATLMTLAMVAGAEASAAEGAPPPAAGHPAGLRAAFGLATALTYAQALLGGMVSTHDAGLACPDWPKCMGLWLPPIQGQVGLQMMHRFGAYTLTLVMIAVALFARTTPDRAVRAGASLALLLTCTQIVLGVTDVLLQTPVWLSAMHLANAVALLATLIATTFRVAALTSKAGHPVPIPVEVAR